MVSHAIWENKCAREFLKNAQIALVLGTRAILNVFQKLTRACFSQIALETILLPILIIIILLFNLIFTNICNGSPSASCVQLR